MANSMLTMPYMTSLLQQAKTRYTITDKSSGEVLGFAFMIVDGQVIFDQVQMVPWHAQDDDLDYQQTAKDVDDDDTITGKWKLASDLDISQDSSINVTEEEEFSSPGYLHQNIETVSNVDKNANNFTTSFVSVKEDFEIISGIHSSSSSLQSRTPPGFLSPILPTALASVTQSLAAQIAAKIVSEASEDTVEVKMEAKEDIEVGETNNDDSPSAEALGRDVVASKRKCEAELVAAKKVYCEKIGAGGKGIGKYKSFYSEVAESQPVDKFKPRNMRKVRCLLCADGRMLSIGNFGEHCKALHEPPIKCDICGGEFRAKKLSIHKKKCAKEEPMPDKLKALTGDPEISSFQGPIVTTGSENSLLHGLSTVEDSKAIFASSKDDISSSVVVKEGSGEKEKVSFTLSSANVKSISYNVELRKGSKIKKAMKKFGKKYKVAPKELKFTIGGKELTGKEKAGTLESRNLVVWLK